MNNHLHEVFNTYNINILFTVFALPCRVSLGFNPAIMSQPGQPGGGTTSINGGSGL
jgi:hypothetical protein